MRRAPPPASATAASGTTPPRPRRTAARQRALNPRVLQEVALQHFLEVAHAGSITQAAARLGVAPSAVSRQVARLERELDTLLFERRARGVVLNSAGELLAAHARRAWLDIERVAEDILALRGLRKDQVRVAATEGFAYEFLPSLVAQYQARNHHVGFLLQMCVQAEVVRRVREGEVDIGVTVNLQSERDLNVELRHPSPVLAVVAAGHPLAARRQVSLAQVVAYPLAMPSASSTLRRLLDVGFSRQGLAYDTRFSSDHLFPLVAYVAETQAVTFCGELALRQHLRHGSVVAVPLRDREMTERHFEVQTLAGRHLPDTARAFIDHLRQQLGQGGG